MAIMDPWPPDDPPQPLPFDQRGCCWPWGPGGPFEKVQLRYGAKVDRVDGGAMNIEWLIMELGYLFIADELGNSVHQNFWTLRTPDNLTHITIEGNPLDQPVEWNISCTMSKSGLPICVAHTQGTIPIAGNTAPMFMPITDIVGPAPRPDRIVITPFRWYETSLYPYFPP